MKSFGFVGKSRLEAAKRVLPGAVARWRAEWCFDGHSETEVREAGSASSLPDPRDWLHAGTSQGSLWIGGHGEASWFRRVFAALADDVPVDATAADLVRQAQLGMVNALFAALEQAPVHALSNDAPADTDGKHSARILVVLTGEDELFVLLDAGLLNAFLPVPAAREPLVDRKRVVGTARARLKVSLPLLDMSVMALGDLRPGDIVKTSAPLSQTFQLRTERDELLASGFLARAGSRLALQLIER